MALPVRPGARALGTSLLLARSAIRIHRRPGASRPTSAPNDRGALTGERPNLRALTGLRFLAALQVLIFHCTNWPAWSRHALLRNVAGCGYVAVSLFFILSGFILTYVHGARNEPLDRTDFYVNRFARIYPAYLFGLLLVAPFYFVHTLRHEGPARLFGSALAVLTLVQAYVPSLALLWNPPAWSLSDEALFYALFPAIAPAVVARRKSVAIGVA